MNAKEFLQKAKDLKIDNFGFDTIARAIGIDKEEVKKLWNESTNEKFKRMPRTEYVMRFLPELSTKFNPYWKLETPHKYLLFYVTPTAPILIPNGFITDKGSIPLIFQNIVSNYDRELIMAFLVHDVECEMQRMSRFMTDGLIYEVGQEMGANWVKNNLVYTTVRLGNRYGKKDKIKRGFNISKYNRDLIFSVDRAYIGSAKQREHLSFVRALDKNNAIINGVTN